MRIILLIIMATFFGNVIIIDSHSEGALKEEVSKDDLFRQMQNQYVSKVNHTDLMQRDVLKYNEKKYGIESVETLESLEAIAWMSMEQQNFREAEKFYLRAIKIRKELLPRSGDNIKELGIIYFMLGDSYLYRSYYAEAIVNYDESMSFTADHGHRGDALSRKGIASEGLKDHGRALGFYLDALKEYDAARILNPKNIKLIDKRVLVVYKRLPELYHKLGENRKVKEYQDLTKDLKAQMKEERRAKEDGR